MPLEHPDRDLLIIVFTVAPCIYYGLVEGISKGMKKPKKIHLPTHPMRREGDKYAWYFYLAYKHLGPDSLVARIPKIGAVATGILAAYALKLVVTKGEQYDYARRKQT